MGFVKVGPSLIGIRCLYLICFYPTSVMVFLYLFFENGETHYRISVRDHTIVRTKDTRKDFFLLHLKDINRLKKNKPA